MSFIDISFYLWWPFCSAVRGFGRGHYEEHFCEIILNLCQWFIHSKEEMSSKNISIFGSGGHFVQQSGTGLCRTFLGNFLNSCQCCLVIFQFFALAAMLFSRTEGFLCKFGRGHYEEHFCEIMLILWQRLRRDVIKIYFYF